MPLGHFEQYRAMVTFHFGPKQIEIVKGTIIEWDGQQVRYGGEAFPGPQFQAALNTNWAVLVGEEDSAIPYRPKPAGIMVRPALPDKRTGLRGESVRMGQVSDDEHEITKLDTADMRRDGRFAAPPPQAPQRKTGATVSAPEPLPYEVDYKIPTRRTASAAPAHTGSDDDSDEAPQEITSANSKPVARILSSPIKRTVLDGSQRVATALRDLDPVHGTRTKVEFLTQPARVPRPVAAREPPISQTFPNGATGDVDVAHYGDDLEDLLPEAASSGVPTPAPKKAAQSPAPKKVAPPAPVSAPKKAAPAKALTWDLTPHWRDRVKIAVEHYGDNQAALNYIFSVESDAVIKNIKSKLARQ